jgi:hypothetical protein
MASFSTYNVFVRKPVYANLTPDRKMMLQTIMASIDDVQTELREEIGNKMPIFQIHYIIHSSIIATSFISD